MRQSLPILSIFLLLCCSLPLNEANAETLGYSRMTENGSNYVILSSKYSFKQQLKESNTIYEIRSLFDLKGEEVVIPNNSILIFRGGKISNGSLKGNNTIIQAEAVKIFDSNVILRGSWGDFVAFAKWFGNTTKDIQRCINSFENKIINIDGDWTYNETIDIPYDSYIQVNNGSIKAKSNGTVFRMYIGHKEISLQNLRIDLDKEYEGTCIEVFGCNHPTIRGFLEPLEKNISESHVYFPVISGTPAHRNNVKNATAIRMHCKERDGDILYFKTFHSSVHDITTGLRLEDISSGINGTTFFIETFFARTGISMDGNLQPSSEIYLTYQDYPKSYKAIQIDNNNETYRQEGRGTYHIIIYDAGEHTNLIDNCLGSVYLSYKDYGYERISNQFVHKSDNISYPALYGGAENPVGSKKYISSYLWLTSIAGENHHETIINLIKSVSKLNLRENIYMEFYTGSTVATPSVFSVLNKLLWPEYMKPQIPIKTASSIRINIELPLNERGQYRRVLMQVIDYTNQLSYSAELQISDDLKNIYRKQNHLYNYCGLKISDVDAIQPAIENQGLLLYDSTVTEKLIISNGEKWLDAQGYTPASSKGNKRPTNITSDDVGFQFFDISIGKPIYWNGSKWIESDGAAAGVSRSGPFSKKPKAKDIYVGFRYFCTDKHTLEGDIDGIEIIHKGSNVWVDALGRIIK